MAEYIEREAAKEAVKYLPWCDWKAVGDCLDELPAADVEVVKHGRWIMKETMVRSPYAKNAYCSECLKETSYHHNYCPNCGAKMDLEG